MVLQVPINEVPRTPSEKKVNECRQKIISEKERDQVEQIDIHGEVAEGGPGCFEESPVMDPELRDSQVVDECVARYGGHQVEKPLHDKNPRQDARHHRAENPLRPA